MLTTPRRLIVTAIMAISLPLGLGAATAAYAGTGTGCSGNSCNGLDPQQSYNQSTGAECSSGASDAHSEPALGGTLELRWGPNCQTNWTRFTPGDNDLYEIYVVRESDGLLAGSGVGSGYYFSNANGVAHYSDQLYSPGPAEACVIDLDFNASVCYKQ